MSTDTGGLAGDMFPTPLPGKSSIAGARVRRRYASDETQETDLHP